MGFSTVLIAQEPILFALLYKPFNDSLKECYETEYWLERMQKAEITAEEYKTLVDGYKRKIDVLNLDKEEIIFENSKMQLLEYRIAEVEDLLGNGRILEGFDKSMFKGLVQRIIVLSQKEIQIDFKCGISVKESL